MCQEKRAIRYAGFGYSLARMIEKGGRDGKKYLSTIEMFVSCAHFGQIWLTYNAHFPYTPC